MRSFLLVIACATVACNGDTEEPAPVPTPREEPACADERELAVPDGRCIAPGIPVDGCADGFVHDSDRGCDPILPSDPCAPGMMAIPGEDVCREVASCGNGTWGDIPTDNTTQHVDASYPGMDSDGSAAKPWTTIGEGVAAAASGTIVAIAAGSYLEDLVIQKQVTLWGRCPSMVEIVGTGVELGTLFFRGVTGSTPAIRNLAVTGPTVGIIQSGVDLTVEQVWVHDTDRMGIDAESNFGATALTVRGSLVESARIYGIYALGSVATVVASEVRDTQTTAQEPWGRGIAALTNFSNGDPASLDMNASVVSRSVEIGVAAAGSRLSIAGSVIRDTLPNPQGIDGRGVTVQDDPASGNVGDVTIEGSVIERNVSHGVFAAGSPLTVRHSVIRDTRLDAGGSGRGFEVQNLGPASQEPGSLTLDQSLIERNDQLGIYASGVMAVISNCVVRDGAPQLTPAGRGLNFEDDDVTGIRGVLELSASLFERNREGGVFVMGSDATIDAVVVRETTPAASGLHGRGIIIQNNNETGAGANGTISSALVDGSSEFGIIISDANGAIAGSVVRNTSTNTAGAYGDGVAFYIADAPDVAMRIVNSRVESSARAGIANFGATVTVESTLLSCQGFDLNGEPNAGMAFSFDDGGGNFCGCPEPTGECKSESAGLEPPAALPKP